MLDIKFIRENPDLIKQNCKNRLVNVDIDKLLTLDEKKRKLETEIGELRAKRNIGSKTKPSKAEIKEMKELGEKINKLETKLNEAENHYSNLLLKIPNIYSKDTPIGPDESGNKVIRKYKEPTEFDFIPKDHIELGKLHKIIDTEKSNDISGARFNYLFGEAVLIQFALIHFLLNTLTNKKIIKNLAEKVGNPFDKPFIPVIPPVMAKSEIMKKMDRFEPIEDRYYLKEDDILLVGSAEHTLGPLHINEVLSEENLPIRYIGYSTAFRREAGSYGKDTAGILRRHQFDKAEMESFIQPEHGLAEQDLIVAIQEYLIQKLEIPYQVVLICTGDMGKPDYRQIDIECWMPGQNKYRETNTSDYMTDFQSRRLNIKYKKKGGVKEFVHMNDATAFAMGRILIAIMENFQQKDGSIIIPEVLRKYMPANIKVIKN